MASYLQKILDRLRNNPSTVSDKTALDAVSAVGDNVTGSKKLNAKDAQELHKHWSDFIDRDYYGKDYAKNHQQQKTTFDGTLYNYKGIYDDVKKNDIVTVNSPNSIRYIDRAGNLLMPSKEAEESDTVLENIQSTAVQRVRYDPDTNVCKVTFVGGDKEYDYNMTPAQFKKFMQAASKGRHVHRVLSKFNLMPGYRRGKKYKSKYNF